MLVLLAALGGCAGYRFGDQSLFNTPDIETVHVPVFQSSSFRRDLGEQLTEAVVKEIEKRTPYKVVRDNDADSLLIGRITQEHKHLLVETINGDQREMETNLVVNVRWVKRRGEVIREGKPIKIPNDAIERQRRRTFRPRIRPIDGHRPTPGDPAGSGGDRQSHGSAVVGEPEASASGRMKVGRWEGAKVGM